MSMHPQNHMHSQKSVVLLIIGSRVRTQLTDALSIHSYVKIVHIVQLTFQQTIPYKITLMIH